MFFYNLKIIQHWEIKILISFKFLPCIDLTTNVGNCLFKMFENKSSTDKMWKLRF